MNIGYNGIDEMIKQAKLNEAKKSVNYGRTAGSSGRTYDEEVKMQETIKRERAEKLQMLLNQGDLSTSSIGSASMIPPDPSSLVSPFSKKAKNTANSIYGDTSQRQQSLAKPPLFFKDQTGDGKITRADVIKARTEGYKGSPATMHKGKPHPGEYFIAPNNQDSPGGKGLRKMTKQELLKRDMTKHNDSLRKLPKTDKNHLPTWDTSTNKGFDAQKDYYSNKDNLKRLRKLSEPIRKKYGY